MGYVLACCADGLWRAKDWLTRATGISAKVEMMTTEEELTRQAHGTHESDIHHALMAKAYSSEIHLVLWRQPQLFSKMRWWQEYQLDRL